MSLLVTNAEQIVGICNQNQLHLTCDDIKTQFCVISGKSNLSLAVDKDGNIAGLGTNEEVLSQFKAEEFDQVIDATGKCVLPGFVDGHTHAVWAGDRVHEFSLKLKGASYMEIHAAGGGIGFTVDKTRAATEEELLSLFMERVRLMMKNGSTLIESKSGYGLDTETEVKMLRVLEKAKHLQPVEISSTFCGAHSVPKGSDEETATNDVISNQLAAVIDLVKSKELTVDNIDVFCEKGVFGVESTRKILLAGKAAGMNINFHAEELNYIGGVEMGAELESMAISHLEEISEDGIRKMAESKSVAVILPTTAHILRLKHPPVRKMLDEGVIVALGTDFNPNAYCVSMPTVMNLACIMFRISMEEALVAATLNAAASIGKSSTHGSLEVGKVGDMVLIDAPRWEHVIYQMNAVEIISHVVKKGKVVHQK